MGDLSSHAGAIRALTTAGDATVFSGAMGTIRMWSPSGEHMHALQGHTQTIVALATDPNGTLYSGSVAGTLLAW